MALFHIKTQILTRSKGQNVIEAIAYRRAVKLKDERTGELFDYSKKKEVIYSEIMIPKDAPQWLMEIAELQQINPDKAAELLWNSVEKNERRRDAQLAREMNIALPLELNQEQCIALTREYVQIFCNEGMVADFSIHWDKGNPHAHITLSMRRSRGDGWGNKERNWNSKELHAKTMKHLAEVTNKHLALAGFENRISHLSYTAQGIDLEPTIHEGNRNNLANQQAKTRNKEIRLRNLQKITDNPQILLEKLVLQNPSFNIADITKALTTYIESANDAFLGPLPPKPTRLSSRIAHFIKTNVAPQFLNEPQYPPSKVTSLYSVAEPVFDISTVKNPQELITKVFEEVARHESVFNEKYLTNLLSRHVANPELVTKALLQIKASPELIAIGPGEDGRERYTTHEMFELENNLQELAGELNEKANHKVNGRTINKCIKAFNLKDDQAKAIRHILKGNDITVMVGRAGTGKSYSLKAARAAWEASGYKIYGIALAGIAADNLALDSGIESRTIESFCYAMKEEKLKLSKKDVVVMDEAGMTDSFSMSKVLTAIVKAKAKLVLVGDSEQLQPVGPGAIFRALSEQIGFAELTTIRRQIESWQREATAHFAAGRTEKALGYYEDHDCIQLSDSRQEAMQKLIQDWSNALQTSSLSENLILAYQNEHIRELNKLAREHLVAKGILSHSALARNEKGPMEVAIGERLLFLENNWRYGIRNGQRATVIDFEVNKDKHIISIKVLLDGNQKKIIEFSPEKYQKFTYGYAVTVHRSQGATVLHSFILALGRWNKHLAYVAMTRHKKTAKLYGDKETHPSIHHLKKEMAKLAIKDSILDYPLAFAVRRGIDAESILDRLQKHMIEKFKAVKQNIKNRFEETFAPKSYWASKAKDLEKRKLIQETLTRREDAKLVANYIEANHALGKAWEILSARQKVLGIDVNTLTKEIQKLLQDDITLKNFKEANIKRDALAFEIYKEHNRYMKAIELYDISLEKLEQESKRHQAKLRVEQYRAEAMTGRIIHRDKLAFMISQDVKIHYTALITSQIPMDELKTHARAHARRKLLRTLSSIEREGFTKVETYVKCTKESANTWAKIKEQEKALKVVVLIPVDDLTLYEISRLQALAKSGKPISRELLLKAHELNQQRDALASQIYNDLNRYKVGLDFFEINHQTITDALSSSELKVVERANERFEKLQKQAMRFNQKEKNIQTVKEYLGFLNKGDENRYVIANQIIHNKRDYYNAIFELSEEPLGVLRMVNHDAKIYQRHEYLERLNSEERKAFLKVEQYYEANKIVNKIWHETKDAPEDKASTLKEMVTPYLILRDELAAAIDSKADIYKNALQFFNLKLESLNKGAFYHQLRQDLIEFKNKVGDFNARITIARKIVSNKSAYRIIKEDNAISWRKLQSYADYGFKLERLSSLSLQEKKTYQEILKYKRLRREAGKLWGEIFKQKREDKEISDELFDKAIALNIERNKLAFTIKDCYEQFDALLFSSQIQTKDIQKHAFEYEKFLKRQKDIESIQKRKSNVHFSIFSNPVLKAEKVEFTYWDADAVNEALSFRAAQFIEFLLGAPNRNLSTSSNYRYGKKGSLSITISGKYAGTWKDFESCEKGNLISLIERQYNYDFKKALQYAAEWVGIKPETNLTKHKKKTYDEITLKSQGFSKEQLEKIEYAKSIVKNSISIVGTIAERYLKEHRGILEPVLEESFKYNPAVYEPITKQHCPALVVVARNEKQAVQAVQCIYLDKNTGNKLDIEVKKRSYGPLIGASILIQRGDTTNQFALAEGPETALSVAEGNKALWVWATLGVSNFANTTIPMGSQDILLCADNDHKNAKSTESLDKAAQILSERGLNVWCSKPINYKDFNDILRQYGTNEVKQLIKNKTLINKASTLEHLIENRKEIISDNTKVIVEFELKHREHQSLSPPKTKKEVQMQVSLFEQIGKLAVLIKENVVLKEMTQRHNVDKKVFAFAKDYREHQKWSIEANNLMEKIKTKDPIKDYLEAIEQQGKLPVPWLTNSTVEKTQWKSLNDKIQQLAFIIDKSPVYQYAAKELNIYDKIKKHSFEMQTKITQHYSLERGIRI